MTYKCQNAITKYMTTKNFFATVGTYEAPWCNCVSEYPGGVFCSSPDDFQVIGAGGYDDEDTYDNGQY